VNTPTSLCLLDGRFRVEATFTTAEGGGTAQAQELSDDAGTFSFFDPDNREVLWKVLDACAVNGHFWVYGAAATDVGFTITVTDTATGAQQQYTKQQGPPAPAITDSGAFATCGEP
jgi:hypothetical protein